MIIVEAGKDVEVVVGVVVGSRTGTVECLLAIMFWASKYIGKYTMVFVGCLAMEIGLP